MYDDTIAAIATPPGQGGIGIVRLSGPDAWAIAGRLFSGKLQDRLAVHGYVRAPTSDDVIDEALVTAMRAPATYTSEDTVELSCHGSPLGLQRVLELVLTNGARLADAGEFTLRAFLGGRIDLAQAESVLDVIQAQTDAGLRLAVQGLRGRLSEPLGELRRNLMQAQAYLVACIDFPEDEVESQIDIDLAAVLEEAEAALRRLLESADLGMIYRNGVRTAIVGRPNVGKSSLLNHLLGEDRAIVTSVPGTTRDTVEEAVTVEGIPFYLIDTAGLHHTDDAVEHLGIERSRQAVERADLLLLMLDASATLTDADRHVLELADGKPALTVANKCDLPPLADLAAVSGPMVHVSALTGQGIDTLHQAMAQTALGDLVTTSDALLVTNPRHKAALSRALTHLEVARESLGASVPEDFVTIDLAACLGALGEITGEGVTDELLDTIFQQFCIGK
jgi:tRNA modification GTPase